MFGGSNTSSIGVWMSRDRVLYVWLIFDGLNMVELDIPVPWISVSNLYLGWYVLFAIDFFLIASSHRWF